MPPSPDITQNSTTLQHARCLAETIGPRGSTTPQEAQAADYAFHVMERAELQPSKEMFTSAQSIWRPYALASALGLAAVALFLFAGQVGAILASALMLFIFISVILELAFEDNPLRRLFRKGPSQNVWAKIPATGQPKQRVVIAGHLDTHRTPKIFSSPIWLRVFQWLVPAGLAAIALNTLIFVIGIFSPSGWWRALAFLPAFVIWELSVLTFEADYTPYTAGASDNATGAGMALSLAAQLKTRPLANTEVWALCSGCEEVGCYGVADFITRHRQELLPTGEQAGAPGKAYFIALDGIGGAGTQPCYITQHTFLTTAKADPTLLRLADEIAHNQPDLGARKLALWGAYTEGNIAAKAGLRVLAISTLNKDGLLPNWHQPSDTLANIDETVLHNTEALVWELLHALDQIPSTEQAPDPADSRPA